CVRRSPRGGRGRNGGARCARETALRERSCRSQLILAYGRSHCSRSVGGAPIRGGGFSSRSTRAEGSHAARARACGCELSGVPRTELNPIPSAASGLAPRLGSLRRLEVDYRARRHDAERISLLAQRKVAPLVKIEEHGLADAFRLIQVARIRPQVLVVHQ